MYEAFFHLHEKPFALTPSHRFLYLGEGHKEAFSLMRYGVVERKGFILLTGDVGTGKTTIVQSLLQSLSTDVECIHISNPLLSREEFIDYVASSTFKKRVHFRSKSDFLFEFEAHLKTAQQHQRAFILIIDEAQTLSVEVLEEIRLLSNLESSEEKLINIFLVGQPELIDRLRDPRCRALYQRIASRFHIRPLSPADTKQYITHRLRVAGAANPPGIFTKQAVEALHRLSRGIPRTLNVIADNALLLGYARGKPKISREMVEESYRDIHLGEADAAPVEEIAPQPGAGRAEGPRTEPAPRLRRGFGWAFASAALLAALIHLSGITVFDLLEMRGRPTISAVPVPPWLRDTLEHPASDRAGPGPPLGAAPAEATPAWAVSPAPAPEPPAPKPSAKTIGPGPEAAKPPPPPPGAIDDRPEVSTVIPGGDPDDEETGMRTVRVSPGDYLAGMAMEVYGRADRDIFELIQRHNPGLTDINRIEVGQTLLFPPLSTPLPKRIFTVHVASYRPNRRAQEAFRALLDEGYEAFIVPYHSPRKGTLYRVTIGSFQGEQEARDYATELAGKPGFSYAGVLQLEMSDGAP